MAFVGTLGEYVCVFVTRPLEFTTNFHVQNGFNNLLSLLDDMGFKYGTSLWDPRYKGLDDYIWEYIMGKKEKSKRVNHTFSKR